MNHKLFVKEMDFIKPLYKELENFRYPEDFARIIEKKFSITPRRIQTSYNNELVAFINNYDTSDFDLRGLIFFDKLRITHNYLIFGKHDDNELGISRSSSEIVMLDSNQSDKIVFYCAKNGDVFLDAILAIAKHTVRAIRKEIADNLEDKLRTAGEAACLSGGENSLEFYKYLLGI